MDRANINEPLDLQEATRRDDIYNELNLIVDRLEKISVYPSLLWVWTFDIIRDKFESSQYDELLAGEPDYIDEVITEGVTLKQIFDKFWDDVDGLGLSMEYGSDAIEDTIIDWMRENDFLVALDDDGWLNG